MVLKTQISKTDNVKLTKKKIKMKVEDYVINLDAGLTKVFPNQSATPSWFYL